MDIKYLEHPCSTADKKEWNKKGYRVVDAKFDPSPVEQKKPKQESKPDKVKINRKG